jgi:hypothetical protein
MKKLLGALLVLAAALLVWALRSLRDSTAEPEKRRPSHLNLRQVGLAIHAFHDAYKRLPPAAICGKDGKPLLSWRVAILPFLGETALYQQFRLDERWDSAHNIRLLEKMPALYAPVGVTTKESHHTFYRSIVGPGTAWESNPSKDAFLGASGLRFPHAFPDGAETLLLVEASEPVPWTKPDELIYDPNGPLPRLGARSGDGYPILMLDLHLQFVPTLDDATLRALITRSGGDVIDPEKLK